MKANGLTVSEAAENWELPLDAIAEIVGYCESNVPLLKKEADVEKIFLSSCGVKLTS
jgi:hypothetical protein